MAEDMSRTIVELTEALDAERRRWTEAEPHVKLSRFFQAFFRDMRDGVAIIDLQGLPLDVNPAFCAMTGFDREEIIGGPPPYPTWPPEAHETNGRILARALHGEGDSQVMAMRRKDGANFRALVTPSVVRREDGSAIAVFTTLKDLTEHELDQQALRESEELHRSVVKTAQEAIFVQQRGGRIVAWNEAATRIFGVDAVTALSQPHGVALMPGWHAIREDGSPLPPEELPSRIALSTGEARADSLIGFVRGDEVRWIEGSATPLMAEGEETPYAVVSICSDVTERRGAEEALRTSRAMRDATERLTGSGSLTLHTDTGRATLSRGVWRLFDLDVAAVDAYGYGNRAELLMSQVHPHDRSDTWSALRSYLAGDPAPVDFRVVHRDGSVHMLHAEPVAADRGPQSGITVHLKDVTERREAEAEIESRMRMRDTAERASRVGSIRYDFATRRALCSSGLFALFDLDPDGYDGDVEPIIDSRVHPDDKTALREMIIAAAETGEVTSLDCRALWRDGSEHKLHGVGVVERDDNGRPVALTGSYRDVTDLRATEEEIRRLNAELAGRVLTTTEQRDALNRELEAFAYSIAHDVRAPLRAIDGFSAVLMEDEIDGLSTEGIEKLRRVRAAAQRLARLLDDLMGLSRVSRRDLLRQPVDISAMATEVAEELFASQPSRKVDLVVQPGLAARADPALIRLALRELLGNAWKFTWPHDSTRIEVGAADSEGERAFFVRDDGVGFDLRHAEHLFGAFQRMHSEDDFPGEGIGLATVQRLVRRHGGRVWAEAAVEQGATFSFTLPDGGAAASGEASPPAGWGP